MRESTTARSLGIVCISLDISESLVLTTLGIAIKEASSFDR